MNLKGTKKKNQVSTVNIFEQQELLKKIKVIRENLANRNKWLKTHIPNNNLYDVHRLKTVEDYPSDIPVCTWCNCDRWYAYRCEFRGPYRRGTLFSERTVCRKNEGSFKACSERQAKDGEPDAGITDEKIILAYFQKEQNDRSWPENASFFAYTATPKSETKTLFGRDSEKIDKKTGWQIPESFDLYPMRQSIEKGYILDSWE